MLNIPPKKKKKKKKNPCQRTKFCEGKVLKFQEYSICRNENFKINWLFDKQCVKVAKVQWFSI
jgi:hypothetical protein